MDERERAWRAEFPITERLTYLNHCSLTPLHERGRGRIERFATEWTEWGGRAWYDHWIAEYDALRADLARVLGASPDEIAIEPNVSAGLVGIASTFDYEKRPKVIVSDLDFPTDGHAFLAVADRGARVDFVRSPDRVRVPLELFERAVNERTAAVCTGHVYFTTGWIQDVQTLAEICHRKGAALIVDAYQSIGALPRDAAERTPIVTLEHPDPAAAVSALRAGGVICDNRPGLIRLSPHYFNTSEEMDRTLELLAPLRVAPAIA